MAHEIVFDTYRNINPIAFVGETPWHGLGQQLQPGGTVVELVIADRHRVKADGIHELDRVLALVGRIEQAALILVAGVQDDDVLPLGAKTVAQLGDLGGQPRDAAETFALGVRLVVAGAVMLVDRLDPAVEIVDVQHMQRIVRLRGTCTQNDRRRRQ